MQSVVCLHPVPVWNKMKWKVHEHPRAPILPASVSLRVLCSHSAATRGCTCSTLNSRLPVAPLPAATVNTPDPALGPDPATVPTHTPAPAPAPEPVLAPAPVLVTGIAPAPPSALAPEPKAAPTPATVPAPVCTTGLGPGISARQSGSGSRASSPSSPSSVSVHTAAEASLAGELPACRNKG